jgi:TPR repeat protein
MKKIILLILALYSYPLYAQKITQKFISEKPEEVLTIARDLMNDGGNYPRNLKSANTILEALRNIENYELVSFQLLTKIRIMEGDIEGIKSSVRYLNSEYDYIVGKVFAELGDYENSLLYLESSLDKKFTNSFDSKKQEYVDVLDLYFEVIKLTPHGNEPEKLLFLAKLGASQGSTKSASYLSNTEDKLKFSYLMIAAMNDPESQFRVSEIMAEIDNSNYDEVGSAIYLDLAAQNKYPPALRKKAGIIKDSDPRKSVEYYFSAIKLGDEESLKAVELLASQGDEAAILHLLVLQEIYGVNFSSNSVGNIVSEFKKDYSWTEVLGVISATELVASAKKFNVFAQYILANILNSKTERLMPLGGKNSQSFAEKLSDLGLELNQQTAIYWLTQDKHILEPKSQHLLGLIYKDGIEAKQDIEASTQYFIDAYFLGSDRSAGFIVNALNSDFSLARKLLADEGNVKIMLDLLNDNQRFTSQIKELIVSSAEKKNLITNEEKNIVEEIEKLNQLYGDGVLSEEEFSAAKRRILGL